MKSLLVLLTMIVLGSSAQAAEPIQVLPKDQEPKPATMIKRWLDAESAAAFKRWDETYENLKTPEQIEAYQKERRERFLQEMGGFPERTPLNPQITGVIQKEGYRIEKVLFESQPKHYVTGLCFVPDSKEFKAPYPAVLVVCGHSSNGKAPPIYQNACALLAVNGVIGFIIDPICQGERYQHIDEKGEIFVKGPTDGHTLIGLGSILLGQNTARFEVWDGMRAIDYLQAREDVDGDKIGCMGNSGGGTQTAQIMVLDDRIQAASPSCYITSFSKLLSTIGPQDAEQNIHGQLSWGMDHADYVMLRAPMPVNICSATRDFFSIEGAWDSYRKAKRLYTRLGYPEKVSLTEVDSTHGWQTPLRESAVQWMVRWLAGRDISIREPELVALSEPETLVTEKGQVQLLPGARSTYDLNLDEYNRFEAGRKELWKDSAAALKEVQKLAGIRGWAEIAAPQAASKGEVTVDSIRIEKWALETEPGILLPALLYHPAGGKTEGSRFVIYINESGKQAEYKDGEQAHSPLSLAKSGATVLAVDLRGWGETSPEGGRWYNARFGEDGRMVITAYLLGRSYLGPRAEDLMATAKWFKSQAKVAEGQLELISVGETGPTALHAAALSAGEWKNVQVHQSLLNWKEIITSKLSEDQVSNLVHGALKAYELTDLENYLKDKGILSVHNPVNALKKPVQ